MLSCQAEVHVSRVRVIVSSVPCNFGVCHLPDTTAASALQAYGCTGPKEEVLAVRGLNLRSHCRTDGHMPCSTSDMLLRTVRAWPLCCWTCPASHIHMHTCCIDLPFSHTPQHAVVCCPVQLLALRV